ncbi:MAG: hypothetical protein JKX68_13245 [Flavobacteriales bacterium]|nr:hypothetical protein [Flavobacteriales bacterium]
MQYISKVIGVFSIVLILFSCNQKIDQRSMFNGRSHKTKKKGIYDAGLNSKKSVSLQIAKEYDKMSKYDTNPKKAARKANKELEKKKRASQKARAKYNKKRHVKVKTTKGKTGGEK